MNTNSRIMTKKATKIEVVATNSPTPYIVQKQPTKGFGYKYRSTPSPVEVFDVSTNKIVRPARRIGVLLALQQVDGVDGSTSSLFKGQYDEKFGDFDPACDIHTDPHIFRSNLMKAGYNETFNPKPTE